MSTDTLSKEIGVWQAAVTNIKARLPELPQLGPTVQELEGVIVEGEEIQSIQDLRRRGRGLRNKLAAGVQSVFGVDSMALLAFGVKPRLSKPRRRLTPDEKIVKLETELEAVKAAKAAAEKKG